MRAGVSQTADSAAVARRTEHHAHFGSGLEAESAIERAAFVADVQDHSAVHGSFSRTARESLAAKIGARVDVQNVAAAAGGGEWSGASLFCD